MGPRRRARECALQMLFQMDLAEDEPRDVFESFFSGRKVSNEVRQFASRLVLHVVESRERIDELLGKAAANWRLERMAAIDRSILRVATGELLGEKDTPARVVINEAIEIAKRYSNPESVQFINGVLDAVLRQLEEAGLASAEASEPA